MKTGFKGFLALLVGFIIVGLFWHLLSTKFIDVPGEQSGVNAEFKSLTPALSTSNVKETIGFYKDTFGFEKKDSFLDEGEYQWAIIEKDSLQIMLLKSEETIADTGNASLIIGIDNIDEVYEQVKDKCEIVEDMHVTPQAKREFSVKDNNGYVIVFRM